MLNRKCGI